MALTSQFSQAAKVAVIEKINEIVDFADSIADRLSQQNYATVLFVLWCGLAVGVVRLRGRSALLQKQLDKLGQDVRQLEFKESRRLMEVIHSRSRSESQTQQQDVPSIVSPEETGVRLTLGRAVLTFSAAALLGLKIRPDIGARRTACLANRPPAQGRTGGGESGH